MESYEAKIKGAMDDLIEAVNEHIEVEDQKARVVLFAWQQNCLQAIKSSSHGYTDEAFCTVVCRRLLDITLDHARDFLHKSFPSGRVVVDPVYRTDRFIEDVKNKDRAPSASSHLLAHHQRVVVRPGDRRISSRVARISRGVRVGPAARDGGLFLLPSSSSSLNRV
ncbi:hypothetical protein JCM11491_005337 [Sporobolomyces phaffii]